MPSLGFKSMNPRPKRRFTARPRWQNRNDIPRIGGRRASNLASQARWERKMGKYQSYGKKFMALNRIVDRFLRWVGVIQEYEPDPPPEGYKTEVL
jgi:hypothetical protein